MASVAVAILASGEQEFPAGSPEEAVQHYLRAVADRDTSTAVSFLSADLTDERCDDQHRDALGQRRDNDFRASLDEILERDRVTEVRIRITETYGDPPFDGGESTWDYIFELEQQDGEWRFVELPWPLWCRPQDLPRTPAAAG
ncbi:MAG: hypothetical protein GEU80_04450 [Dehalococcoidia bacterium]|nr:hypothetical protein [Dehalococcoidia bacterium]